MSSARHASTNVPHKGASNQALPRAWLAVAATALVGAVAWIYMPLSAASFVRIDDPDYVSANAVVARGLTWDGFVWAFGTFHASNWHPLTWLSHQLDVQWFGSDAGAHHRTNVVLHAANALLLWFALARLTGASARAFVVALVFAVHPLRVESVAWVAERKDVLSTLFLLLALLAYERHARQPSARRLALVATAFALGLLAKPMIVTLPFLLLLLDAWPLGRGTSWALVREKWPLFALSAASCVVTYAAQSSGGAVASMEAGAHAGSFVGPLVDRVGNAVVAYGTYLGQLVWPADLSVHVPHAALAGGTRRIVSALVLIAISTVVVLRRRSQPWLVTGWCWYLGTLVPVIGLVQVGLQASADRYTYVPLVGIVLAVVWWVGDRLEPIGAARVRAAVAAVLALVVVVPASVAARAQVATWHDSLTLFTHAVAVHPESALTHQSLGDEWVERGQLDEGLRELRRAVELDPGYEVAHNGLGVALGRAGRAEEGLRELEQAVALKPGFFEAWYNLGIARYESGDVPGASDAFARAVALRAWHYEARANLATALVGVGRLDAAREHVRVALRLAPDAAGDVKRVALIAAAAGDAESARVAWRRVLALDSADADARRALQEH